MGNLKIEYVRELGATKKTILKCQSLRCPKKKSKKCAAHFLTFLHMSIDQRLIFFLILGILGKKVPSATCVRALGIDR